MVPQFQQANFLAADVLREKITIAGSNCDPCPAEAPFCLANGTCIALTCDDLFPYRLSYKLIGIRTRQLCPVKSGCTNPLSGQILSAPSLGCPSRCFIAGSSLATAVEALPCQDRELDSQELIAFIDALAETTKSDMFSESIRGSYEKFVIPVLRASGCNALKNNFTKEERQELCDAAEAAMQGRRTLAYVCPVACGCRGIFAAAASLARDQSPSGCPTSCLQVT